MAKDSTDRLGSLTRWLWFPGGLIVWVVLFTGGIITDTCEHRWRLSPGGTLLLAGLDRDAKSPCRIRQQDATTSDGRTTGRLEEPERASELSVETVGQQRGSSPPRDTTERPSEKQSSAATEAQAAKPESLATEPESVNKDDVTQASLPSSLLTVFLFFTPTNLALLCCFAGFLGAVGNYAQLHDDDAEYEVDQSNPYTSGILRGFFVYLASIAGLLILSENPFRNVSPHQYIRTAGFMSTASFLVSYRPRVFAEFVLWMSQRVPVPQSPNAPPSQPGAADQESAG